MPEQPASAKVEVKAPPAHLVDPGRWEKWAPGEPKRPQKEYGPIRVGLAMNVIRINSVDVRAQTFSAYFNVRLEWVDKYYIGGKSNYATQPDIGMAAEDWPDEDTSMQGVKISCTEFPKSRGPRWRPHIKFTNSVEPLEEQQRDYNVDADTGRVTLYYEAVGTFSEMMELNYFPFDRQLLTIEVTTPHRIDKCMFIPHREPNGYKGALVTNEWQVSPFLIATYTYEPKDKPNENKGKMLKKAIKSGQRLSSMNLLSSINLLKPQVEKGASVRVPSKPEPHKYALPTVEFPGWDGSPLDGNRVDQGRVKFENVHFTSFANANHKYHAVSLQLLVQRHFLWHRLNILPVCYVIAAVMAFAPLCGWQTMADRLALLMFAIFSFIALKSAVIESLPIINYFTMLDRYLVAVLTFMSTFWVVEMIALWYICQLEEVDETDAFSTCALIDQGCGVGYLVILTLGHVWIIIKARLCDNENDQPIKVPKDDCAMPFKACGFHQPWEKLLKEQNLTTSVIRRVGHGLPQQDIHA